MRDRVTVEREVRSGSGRRRLKPAVAIDGALRWAVDNRVQRERERKERGRREVLKKEKCN